jgi:hypothetical protein
MISSSLHIRLLSLRRAGHAGMDSPQPKRTARLAAAAARCALAIYARLLGQLDR